MATDPLRGKTIRWTYEDGPTKGTTFEHTFHADGTVSYRMLGAGKPGSAGDAGGAPSERAKYEIAQLSDTVTVVSYLAPSGWTLTTVLDSDDGRIVSFASNEKQLVMQRGTFELQEHTER
jgi:hypothetical protein